jgi:hypothetical protein
MIPDEVVVYVPSHGEMTAGQLRSLATTFKTGYHIVRGLLVAGFTIVVTEID